jgi:anaerobic glycerol-3-phosphate dehydrogenase
MLADDCINFAAVDRLLGSDDGFRREVQFFLDAAAAAGCEYRGRLSESIRVPTILGTFRQVTLAPLYFGEFDPSGSKQVVVIGFPSILDFDAKFVAERLASKARSEGVTTRYMARQLEISPVTKPPRLEIQFAAQFDRDRQFHETVVSALASVGKGADLLILPGVLGLNTTTDELTTLWRRIGCPFCEIATLPPSVLGIRLLRRWEQYLSRIGVERFAGFAVRKLWLENQHCRGVVLDSPGRSQRLEAKALVLATGAFSHLVESRAGGPVPGNVWVCGGALNVSNPRNENAIALVTGVRAGLCAANVGAQTCGKMTGDWITALTAPIATPPVR